MNSKQKSEYGANAIRDYEYSIKAGDKSGIAYINLGIAYWISQGLPDKAIDENPQWGFR